METNTIIQGDCLEVMKQIPDGSVDTIITDPPYGLSFMGKKWDYDVPAIDVWVEALRVLKPGGTLLCFAGSRTQHRMAVNVEDAGFILKDCIMWLYGSGFPKATDISKQLDKAKGTFVEGKETANSRSGVVGDDKNFNHSKKITESNPQSTEAKLWNGWKSHGLKPAYEPILVAMKPNDGTYANNALKHGVSGLNIDGGRISYVDDKDLEKRKRGVCSADSMGMANHGDVGFKPYNSDEYISPQGRFPANLLLSCDCDDYYLTGNALSGIMQEKLKETSCQLKNLQSSANNAENTNSRESTNRETKTWYFAVERVSTSILEKILGRLLDGINKMDTGCSGEMLLENMNTSLNTFTCGKSTTEKYQQDTKCTISTVREMITDWKTCSAWSVESIKVLLTKIISGVQEQKQELSHNPDCPVRMLDEQSNKRT
jgi:site-specific DNA-methyltransferase (adenine-specific)